MHVLVKCIFTVQTEKIQVLSHSPQTAHYSGRVCSTLPAWNPRILCYLLLVLSTITSMKKFTLSVKLFSTSLPLWRCR